MCTVTLIARKRGYLLGMNRDEKRSRPKGLPPSEKRVNGHRVIYPSEPSGGTWISLNDSGVAFSLINWYSVARRVTTNPVSRGEVIPSMSTADSAEFVEIGLAKLPLPSINPFRLIGIFPECKEVLEWQWDLSQLVRKTHHWRSQQWISSGFDEPTAQIIRSQTFAEFLSQSTAGTSDWLRRLHASHTQECGPFSTCMHRSDAVTVSYTEISVTTRKARVRYYPRAPCEESPYSPCICPVRHFARKRTQCSLNCSGVALGHCNQRRVALALLANAISDCEAMSEIESPMAGSRPLACLQIARSQTFAIHVIGLFR